jgi:hypothetical protein
MMLDLLKNDTIEEVARQQLVWINPTNLVRKENGKYRLVIDTRLVNRFLKKIHFKMEGIPTLIDLWEINDWAISFDLKDAYNHVPVHQTMRPMLGISYNIKNSEYLSSLNLSARPTHKEYSTSY